MISVLQRRLMDGERMGCALPPLASHVTVPLDAIAGFIAGELDDDLIESLLWGLILISDTRKSGFARRPAYQSPIPRAYALLKLLFVPAPLLIEHDPDNRLLARMCRDDDQGNVVISQKASILHLLRAGRLGEACAIGMRRLRASGLNPMPTPTRPRRTRDGDWLELDRPVEATDARRLAAALLMPIGDASLNRLINLVISGDDLIYDNGAAPDASIKGGVGS